MPTIYILFGSDLSSAVAAVGAGSCIPTSGGDVSVPLVVAVVGGVVGGGQWYLN